MDHLASDLAPATLTTDDHGTVIVEPRGEGSARRLDIRVARGGNSSPARICLSIPAADLPDVLDGISALLAASDGGQQVARVVRDTRQDRRLRAEIEPFGTRYVARLAFWQQVRSTWRPLDDGLVLGAEAIPELQVLLSRYSAWLAEAQQAPSLPDLEPEALARWPAAGADWLTREPSRIAFHPRGYRVTLSLEETGEGRAVVLCQWYRHDSLWLPHSVTPRLTMGDLDRLLAAMRVALERSAEQSEVLLDIAGTGLRLDVDQERLTLLAHGQEALGLPVDYLAWFGRATAESWAMLAPHLIKVQREEQPALREAPGDEVEDDSADLPWETRPFGEAQGGQIEFLPRKTRIVLNSFASPRYIVLPNGAINAVLAGLDRALRRRQMDYALIAVHNQWSLYIRSGGLARPGTYELRTWHDRDTRAISLSGLLLTELMTSLRRLPAREETSELPVYTAYGGGVPVETGQRAEPVIDEQVGAVVLGTTAVELRLEGKQSAPHLTLHWDGERLVVPLADVPTVLDHLRTLYYDALRGRVGYTILIGEEPGMVLGVHSQQRHLRCVLRQHETVLSFPAESVPELLNAARSALARVQEKSICG